MANIPLFNKLLPAQYRLKSHPMELINAANSFYWGVG
jgi:hypothetical protein